MREYKTQMEAARKGIVTEELKKVAQKEHMRVEAVSYTHLTLPTIYSV